MRFTVCLLPSPPPPLPAPAPTASDGGSGAPMPAAAAMAAVASLPSSPPPPPLALRPPRSAGVQSSCVEDPATKALYCPTSFPNPVNYGMTWHDDLAREMGAIIGTETRALWLAGATEESGWSGRPVIGLDVWSPNINLAREPRWGRNQEVPSEDTFLNGRYGTAYTIGVQTGEDARFFKTLSTLKHAEAYSLEDSDGFTRHTFNAVISNATLADTYWPAFRMAITSPVSPPQSIM